MGRHNVWAGGKEGGGKGKVGARLNLFDVLTADSEAGDAKRV